MTGPVRDLLRAVPPEPERWLFGAAVALLGAAAGILLFGLAGAAAGGALAGGAAAGIVWLRLLAPARAGLRWAERLATHDATFRHLAALRLWLFRRAAEIEPRAYEQLRAGDLLSRMTADIDAVDALHLRVLLPLLVGGAALVSTALLLIAADAVFGIVLATGGAIAFLLVPPLAARLGRRASAAIAPRSAALRERLVEGLNGQAELAAYGAAERFSEDTRSVEAGLADAQLRAAVASAWGGALSAAVAQLAIAGILAIGIGLLGAARAPVLLGTALLLAVGLFELLGPTGGALVALGRVRSAIHRLLALTPVTPPGPPPGGDAMPLRGDIVLEDLRFTYAADRPPVLDGVALVLRAGETVLLEGPSGTGKSTLIALLLRLRDPRSGRIRIGDRDLASLPPERVWDAFTVLPQRFALFAGTLREQLVLGDPEAGDERLRQVLADVGLEAWAAALPDGLDTWLGEGGRKLSGGQARRIALARTLLRDRPFAILDEPTDGLDAETEARIVATLARWRQGRTVLLVSHRPALRATADRILTLSDGRLVELPR